jgi:uncharacterized membrane protein YoaK (UPF0700 family)
VLGAVVLVSGAVEAAGYGSRRVLLVLQAAFLAVCLGLGVGFGPFADPDGTMAVFVGMLAVAAMATQNALVKLALKGAPSMAVMTTNIVQFAIDLATLAGGRGSPDDLAAARSRTSVTRPCVVGFLAGCVAGSALELRLGFWALTLPVVLSALAVLLGESECNDPHATRRTGEP